MTKTMTEDQARKKWCPFVRFNFPPIPDSDGMERWNNRDAHVGSGQSEAACIASDCAAWRWKMTRMQAAQQRAISNSGAEESGYCGLAGKP